jgi:hypothetical protein
MANSEVDLFQVQAGEQTDFDTVAAPTVKLMGVESFDIDPIVEATHVPEMRGDLTPAYQSVVDRANCEWTINGTIQFEDICYFLDNAFGEASPAGTGPYTRTYNGAGAKPAPKILTLVKGSTEGVYGVVGALATTLELTFEKNMRATYSVSGFGKQFDEDALATLADRAVTICHGNQVALSMDPFGSAAGTTTYPGVKTSATLSVDLARAVKEGLGSLNPVGWKQNKGEPGSNQLSVTLEFDATTGRSKDFLDALKDATHTPFQRVMRLLATYDANHALRVDFAGFTEEAPSVFTDEDGIATLEFNFSAQYEATLGGWLQIVATNQVSALP